MYQLRNTTHRQIYGRLMPPPWILKLAAAGFFCLAPVLAHDPSAPLLIPVFCLPISVFFFVAAIRTPHTVVVDDEGLTVETVLRRWRYPWEQIATIRMGIDGSHALMRLQFAGPAEHRSKLATRIARMTGGRGLLPFLDFDQFETLRQEIARRRQPHSPGPDAGAVWDLPFLIDNRDPLPGINDAKVLGRLASIELEDYETLGSQVEDAIHSGQWEKAACVQQGKPGGNWVFWNIVERETGEGAVVEVVNYFAMDAGDDWRVVRSLSRHDMDRVRPYVEEWSTITPQATRPG